MKIITLCGSMRFTAEMKNIARDLETDHDVCIIQCIYNEENKPLEIEKLRKITQAHYHKIDISDAIYVVNIGGYIGEAVQDEIKYAFAKNKEVIYHC